MAHFAKIENGVVTQVIVADQSFVDTQSGTWVKTSYNMLGGKYIDPATGEEAADQSVITGDEARERKNFASIGGKYDGTGFIPVRPFPSWTMNSTTYLWESPIDMPSDAGTQNSDGDYIYYNWSETTYNADTANPKTQGWVKVVIDGGS